MRTIIFGGLVAAAVCFSASPSSATEPPDQSWVASELIHIVGSANQLAGRRAIFAQSTFVAGGGGFAASRSIAVGGGFGGGFAASRSIAVGGGFGGGFAAQRTFVAGSGFGGGYGYNNAFVARRSVVVAAPTYSYNNFAYAQTAVVAAPVIYQQAPIVVQQPIVAYQQQIVAAPQQYQTYNSCQPVQLPTYSSGCCGGGYGSFGGGYYQPQATPYRGRVNGGY